MGRLISARVLRVLAISALAIGAIATWALAAGPGGWDHLGTGAAPGSKALNLSASALEVSGTDLYVGGKFTNAGGIANADGIAKWNGSTWSAVGPTPQISGEVVAIAVAGGKVYAGGTFTNAGTSSADNLAVWDGNSWEPFCTTATETIGNVRALQVIGPTLYVGGDFQDGAGIEAADYLLACNLATGKPSETTVDPAHPFSGPVKALTATNDGTLYAGGRFGNLDNIAAADNIAYLPAGGTWHAMGSSGGGPTCDCALDAFVRGLATNGTDVFVGTEGSNIAGIAQADHVAKWDGSSWSAMGSNTAGNDGWFPPATNIYGLASVGSNVFATGTFQDANGDARADNVAWFDGTKWQPMGSNGAGNGPWVGEGSALAVVDRQLYAAGNFTSAGGDTQAQSAASFSLTQVIAYPTPTVTPGPSAVATPTVTPSPTPTAAADTTAPKTRLRKAKINQAKRKATFSFASGERGSKFLCKLDKRKFKACTSPKTYKKLKPGKHVFRVKARDRAGNVDKTPTVKRFKIVRRR